MGEGLVRGVKGGLLWVLGLLGVSGIGSCAGGGSWSLMHRERDHLGEGGEGLLLAVRVLFLLRAPSAASQPLLVPHEALPDDIVCVLALKGPLATDVRRRR